MKEEKEPRQLNEIEDCINRVLGVCPDCQYDPIHNRLCKIYIPVRVHILE